jgi:hypothetical protein
MVREGIVTELSKARALAIRELTKAEAALIAGDWSKVRVAAIRLAAQAADRAAKQ